jgi:hypothetical protein
VRDFMDERWRMKDEGVIVFLTVFQELRNSEI